MLEKGSMRTRIAEGRRGLTHTELFRCEVSHNGGFRGWRVERGGKVLAIGN